MLRYVAGNEGAHFRLIQRELGLSTGQTDHHLRRFVRQGWLASTRLAGEVHFFPVTTPRHDRRPVAALRHPLRAATVQALREAGPSPLRALARRVGRPESTVVHHLRVLVRAGLVYRAEEDHRVTYGLSDADALPGQLRAAQGQGQGTTRWPPADA